MAISNNGEIPKGWIKATLEDVLIPIRGISFPKEAKKNSYAEGLIACLRTTNIQEKVEWGDLWFVDEGYVKGDDQIVEKGDILISISNSLVLLGKVSLVNEIPYKSTLGAFIADLRTLAPLSNKFIYHYMSSLFFKDDVRRNGSTTTNISNISVGKLARLSLPIPPLSEQHRIVAKIEELFSELDKGVENLRTAREQLKVYRQSALKHAFEGKLTEQWRKEHASELEPAEVLLKKIKTERERRYQQQFDEWQRAAKMGKRLSKLAKLKELPPLTEGELAELPKLPEGWGWGKIGYCTLGVEYGTSAKSQKTGGTPVLRMGNIQRLRFDWDDLVYSDNKEEINKYLLRKGDVLFNRTNSPELVGKTAIYRGERPAIFAGYLIRVNQITSIVDSDYLDYYLNSHIAKKHGNRVKTDGVNQSNINGVKLTHYPFPYCSIDEQIEIVQQIETRLSVVDQLEQTIDESLQKAEALRQSILKKAFEGNLVSQAPSDEPASVLLERIKAERAKQAQNKKITARRKSTSK